MILAPHQRHPYTEPNTHPQLNKVSEFPLFSIGVRPPRDTHQVWTEETKKDLLTNLYDE